MLSSMTRITYFPPPTNCGAGAYKTKEGSEEGLALALEYVATWRPTYLFTYFSKLIAYWPHSEYPPAGPTSLPRSIRTLFVESEGGGG